MNNTKIEWADEVWNPVTGCTKVSEGCRNCYAERMAKRLAGRYGYPKEQPFAVTPHPDRLELPMKWKKPRRIFVNSMGDLFHEDMMTRKTKTVLPSEFGFGQHAISLRGFYVVIMDIVEQCPQHTFLFLTKRPEIMSEALLDPPAQTTPLHYGGGNVPLPNVWLGVSVEDQETADRRIPELLRTPAARRFVSLEPMLGPVDLAKYLPHCDDPTCEGECGESGRRFLDWVILGGESGPGARPMHPDWVRSVRDQCAAAGVPFFFKGWGEWAEDYQHGHAASGVRCVRFPDGTLVERIGKKYTGRKLDGREHLEFPEAGR